MKLLDENISLNKIVKTFDIDLGNGEVITVQKWQIESDWETDADWSVIENVKAYEMLSDNNKNRVDDFVNELSLLKNNERSK